MRIGFLGAGNMGGAIIQGYAPQARHYHHQLLAYDPDRDKIEDLAEETGLTPCASAEELASCCDVLVLGLKPGLFADVLPALAPHLTEGQTVVSMAAGVTIGYIEQLLGRPTPVIRIMPNTPAAVGQAMTAVCRNERVDDTLFKTVFEMFTAIGRAEEVPEDLIHCVIGVSGSSPAYTYMYIDALARAAEKNGMAYDKAVVFAAQSVLGAAQMVLSTGETPEQLRINVCSPGGTTIEAVETLQAKGFAEVIAAGFQAAVDKSKRMSK
jgi:pyrroline-5-carboxylate reductase